VVTVGVDVGGTNIQVGLVGDDHTVVGRAKRPTPRKGPTSVIEAVLNAIAGADGDAVDIEAVGIGIPGAVHGGEVVQVPNLAGWDEPVDIRTPIGEALGVPVVLGNDANVGLLGEWVAGAARGHDDVLGVWLGTGIGGGLILHGRPYDGSFGSAGEIGHVIVRSGGALCSCGRRGCVEAYAGRRMMAGAARAMVEAGRSTDLFDIQRDEGKSRPTSKVWARALDEEDELATQLFDAAIDAVAVGVGSVVNLLDVSLVVVGGGMAEKLGQDLADRIFEASRPWMLHPNPKLSFAVSALGDDAGVVGAAALARADLISG
jgi:glucokinase